MDFCKGKTKQHCIRILNIIFECCFNSFNNFRVNFLDIAPQHASVLLGLSNTFGTLAGVLGPTLAGFIVKNAVSRDFIAFTTMFAFHYFLNFLILFT